MPAGSAEGLRSFAKTKSKIMRILQSGEPWFTQSTPTIPNENQPFQAKNCHLYV
jgi:hypothetical protein